MIHFIYRPKSGDRVFAENPNQEIAVVRWANGCRHVVGGVHLQYDTAIPGRYWRSDAKWMASCLVAAVGGIAWDDQGTVHLIVPLAWGFDAHSRMASTFRLVHLSMGHVTDRDNETRLILAGAAVMALSSQGRYGGMPTLEVVAAVPPICRLVGWAIREFDTGLELGQDVGYQVAVEDSNGHETIIGFRGEMPASVSLPRIPVSEETVVQ